jgi:hypothetical protein
LPRRYHRPPAAKRRKSKKATTPYAFEAAPESQDGDAPAAEATEAVSTMEPPSNAVSSPVPGRPAVASAARASASHVSRDYSYVRSEILRILLVASFLMVALIITSFFR